MPTPIPPAIFVGDVDGNFEQASPPGEIEERDLVAALAEAGVVELGWAAVKAVAACCKPLVEGVPTVSLRPMPFGGAMVRLPLLHGRIHFVSYSL